MPRPWWSEGDGEPDPVRDWSHRLETRLHRTPMRVALLGAGGRGLQERRAIARTLRPRGILVTLPEDDLPPDVPSSIAEEAILARSDVDLVFLHVESWGSATELGQFHRIPEVAAKLRVLVPPEHHPLHGGDGGYLADLYLTHLAAFGHVYPVDAGRTVPVLSAADLVVALSVRHHQIKALRDPFIK